MKNTNYTIYKEKVNAGIFKMKVLNNDTQESKSYLESNMSIIDAFDTAEGMYGITQLEALNLIINNAGFDN